MRAMGTALLVVATGVAALGCNLILDNDVHELAPRTDAAGTGTGGAGGSGGQSGSGGQGGDAGQGGGAGQGGAAGQGGTPGRGGAGQGGTAGQSGAAGQGGRDRDASTGDDGSAGSTSRDSGAGDAVDADATQPPSDGATEDAPDAPPCVPNTTECRGRSIFLCTPAGAWVEILQCSFACVTGACAGDCVPGTTQCSGPIPQSCDGTGKWQNGAACPYICSQGACAGMCIPGAILPCGSSTTCNPNGVQTCDPKGIFGPCLPSPSNCAAVPQDWEPVALTQGQCPSGFGSPQTFYTSATGTPYTCGCSCGGSQSCAGSVTLNEYSDDISCTANRPIATTWLDISPTCAPGSYGDITAGNSYAISDVVYGPSPDCSADPVITSKPLAVTQTVSMCTPAAVCPSGACLSAQQSANLCIYRIGTNACPTGYPNSTLLAPFYDDTRACGSCACKSVLTCTLDEVVLNNDASCGVGHPYMMTATTRCTAASIAYPLNAVVATGTSAGDPTCIQTSPSDPVGEVSLNAGTIGTVCCK